jgi:hypothetical protein
MTAMSYGIARGTATTAPDFHKEDPSAQDVIDALRIALAAHKDDPAEVARIVSVLVEYAPETDSNRGIDLLLHLITQSVLKASVA